MRDFLQVAVLDDGVLPSIVEQIETYEEIKHAWTIFDGQKPRPTTSENDAFLWLGTLQRMLDSAASNPIERLELTLNIYDYYHERDIMLETVVAAGKQLEETLLDEDDVSSIKDMLENISFHLLPKSVQDELQNTVTTAACELLQNCGNELAFDDIEGLDEALQTYGSTWARRPSQYMPLSTPLYLMLIVNYQMSRPQRSWITSRPHSTR